MIFKNPKITLITTFIVAFLTYSFWSIIKEKTGIRIFYSGIALSFVGYTYTIHLLFKALSQYQKRLRHALAISYVVYLTTINNLIDEILFDPKTTEINEYVGFILILILTYFDERKNDIRRKKRNL